MSYYSHRSEYLRCEVEASSGKTQSHHGNQSIQISRKMEIKMKAGIKDELKGKAHQVKGALKETAGKVINNPKLEAEGQHERVAGKVQKKIGQVERVFEK